MSFYVYIVIIVIIVITLWVISNYDFVRKVKDPIVVEKTVEEIAIEDDEMTSSVIEEVFSAPISIQSYSVDESIYSYSVDENSPELPLHIDDPDYRPPSTRKVSGIPASKGEGECLRAASLIFGAPFYNLWPTWLINPKTGRGLELDIYNEDLGIAIEYHGIQHYKYTPFYHKKGKVDFYSQVYRDNIKIDICKENKVFLIVVPYTCPNNKIEEYIRYKSPYSVLQRNAIQELMN